MILVYNIALVSHSWRFSILNLATRVTVSPPTQLSPLFGIWTCSTYFQALLSVLHISPWTVYILAILNFHIDSSKRKWMNQARSDSKLDLRPRATTTRADWELLDPLLCLPLGATESQVLQSFSISIRPCYFSSSFYENWFHAMLIFAQMRKLPIIPFWFFATVVLILLKWPWTFLSHVNSVGLDVVTPNQCWKQRAGVSRNQRNRTYCVTLSYVVHAGATSLVHWWLTLTQTEPDSISGARQVCSAAAPCWVSLKMLKRLRFHCNPWIWCDCSFTL